MNPISKEELIEKLKSIRARGWIENRRANNNGGAGNTLEDLLGIQENNLALPNAGEWELKCQIQTNTLMTMFHREPSPRAMRFVPNMMLPHYGWPHKEAGKKYPKNEKSFRQTIHVGDFSSRGFSVKCNDRDEKIEIMFRHNLIAQEHSAWAREIAQNNHTELQETPYWGFSDLYAVLRCKLYNCFYVLAEKKREGGANYLRYTTICKLAGMTDEKFIHAVKDGHIYVDFDARTGHNHGTKFRIKQSHIASLYSDVEKI